MRTYFAYLSTNYYLHYLSADFTSQQMQNAVHWMSMHKLCTITVSMAYMYTNTENPNDEAKMTQPAKSVRYKIVCQQAGNAASISERRRLQ